MRSLIPLLFRYQLPSNMHIGGEITVPALKTKFKDIHEIQIVRDSETEFTANIQYRKTLQVVFDIDTFLEATIYVKEK